MTADFRGLPDFVIIGAMRSGTTSLSRWLRGHPDVATANPKKKEIHYFDRNYERGIRWYRAQFPVMNPYKITGETSPYMLFHPLAPARAVRDLPVTTRFIVLLRDPVQRAISHYWLNREIGLWESEPIGRAFDLEPERLVGAQQRVLGGKQSVEHTAFSYLERGQYAPQLRRWFDEAGRQRVLVLESERLFTDPGLPNRVLEWLGLPPHAEPFPKAYGAGRTGEDDPELLARLRDHFEPHNRELFDLLGYELWNPTSGGDAAEPDRFGPCTSEAISR